MRKTLFYIFILCLISSACGKKAPPTLRPFEKPDRPENLRAIHNEKGLIISWSYPDRRRTEIRGFILLRSEGRDFERIGYVDARESKLSYTDRKFNSGKAYRYRVLAKSLRGVMSDAVEITATPSPLPQPPENPRFVIKNELIELSWNEIGACFNIYKAYEGGDYFLLNEKPLCKTLFTDRASPERPVRYIIRSVTLTDIINEGPPSEVVTIRPEDYIPSPPSEIRLVPDKGRVFILWRESPETWVRGYRIYRRLEDERDFKIIGESLIPAFTDATLEGLEGKRIFYMIKAVGPSAESLPLSGDMNEPILP